MILLLLSGASSSTSLLRVLGGGGGGAVVARIPFPSAAWTRTTRRRRRSSRAMMEGEDYSNNNRKGFKHDDPFDPFRWTARESFQFMYGGGNTTRPWNKVSDFYSHLISHHNDDDDDPYHPLDALSTLFPHHRLQKQKQEEEEDGFQDSTKTRAAAAGRWERLTFRIVLSYHGRSFDGWQKQPDLNTVQGLVEKSLGRFVDDRKANQLREKSLPLEGCAAVAGRTDKGVTALQQVCSFYTWRKDVTCEDIKDAVNNSAPGKIRAVSVSKVSRIFHPTFAAKWRRYFYIFPLDDGDQDQDNGGIVTSSDEDDDRMKGQTESYEVDRLLGVWNGNEDLKYEMKPKDFDVSKVNELLRQLEGRSFSYKIFARDTKASRSIGPPTECFMFHARAAEAKLPCINQGCKELRVMCVELVANRFLRKMVRVLVATAIREAAAGANNDALLKLMDASCRRATAPPAPPDGLCLVDVGYGDFIREKCFIQ